MSDNDDLRRQMRVLLWVDAAVALALIAVTLYVALRLLS